MGRGVGREPLIQKTTALQHKIQYFTPKHDSYECVISSWNRRSLHNVYIQFKNLINFFCLALWVYSITWNAKFYFWFNVLSQNLHVKIEYDSENNSCD